MASNLLGLSRVFATSCLILAFSQTAHANNAFPGFTDRAVKGPYTFHLEGVVTFVGGQPAGLPTWAVGRFVADGQGNLSEIESTLNVGGCVVIRQTGDGTYAVERNGTGSAETTLTNDVVEPVGGANAPCPALDTSLLAKQVGFSFEFAINPQGLEIVGLDWTDANGVPIVAFGSQGAAQPQFPRRF